MGRYYTYMSDRCTGRAQPRTTRSGGHHDHITTGACQGTLEPPLSRWILLRPDDNASCHLRRRQGAQHSSEPALAADPPQQMGIRAEQPASTEEAWWRTSEQGIHSSGGAEEGSYLIHLTDVPNSFVPTAAGARLPPAHTMITLCRMSIELPLVSLERLGMPNYMATRCGGRITHTHNK